jgi:thiol-disulfide isomerase/thioredoxin
MSRNKFTALWRGFLCILWLVLAPHVQAQEGRWTSQERQAPALSLAQLDGTTLDIAQFKGRIVIVNFWATWCGPCVAEMPSLQALAKRLGDKAVVIGVNYHESPEKVRAFQARYGIQFALLRDPWHQASSDWGVQSLPSTFIVDSQGQLRLTAVGEVDWLSPAVAKRLNALTVAPVPISAPIPAPASARASASKSSAP